MGTPIKGKTYSMAPTPEGEEHPNIMVADLRKAAEAALEALEGFVYHGIGPNSGPALASLRAALAQPDESFCDSHCTRHQHHPDCFMARTEKGPEPIPGATPMAEYAAKSAAVPGRAEALKQAGYTRRPRQLPKEDEQEPVAWINEHGHIDRGLDAILEPTGWTPLYTPPPQRNTLPLSDDEIKCIKPICADFVSFRAGVRHAEREHGIGGEE